VKLEGNTKILYVTNQFEYFQAHWRARAEGAARAGYEVHLAVPGGMDLHFDPFRLWHYPLTRHGVNPFAEISSIVALRRIVRTVQPSIIHTGTVKANLYSALLHNKAVVLMTITGLGFPFISTSLHTRLFVRPFIEFSYRALARRKRVYYNFENYEDQQLFLENRLVEPSLCRSVVLPAAGVDILRFRFTPEPQGVPVVLLASRMLWDKGVGEFVEAARELRARGVAARFVLVGDSDPDYTLAVPRTLLQEWTAEGVVEWWGHHPSEEMPSVLAKANLICLPSYREGFPRALLEAGACGRAIVTTDVPGCRQAVQNGHNGLLIPPRDSMALAQTIATLLRDPVAREEMGRRGREFVVRAFSEDDGVAKTLELYRALLSEDHRGLEIVASGHP